MNHTQNQPNFLYEGFPTSSEKSPKIEEEENSSSSMPPKYISHFLDFLQPMFPVIEILREDANVILRDPALKSWLEFTLYPGLWAIWANRFSHYIYESFHLYFLARLISTG